MFEWLSRMWKGTARPSRQTERVEPVDYDEIANLIENGDPSDPATLERLAKLIGQTEPEKF